MKLKNPARVTVAVCITAVVILLIITSLGLYFDYQAYKEIGENFLEVFFTNLKVKIFFQVISFLIVFIISYLSIYFIKRNLTKIDSTFDFLNKKYILIIGSLILSIVISNIMQRTLYDRFLAFANPTFTDISDPIFAKNIGYYLFQRPFVESLLDSIAGISIFLFIGVLVLYLFLYARLGIVGITDIFNQKGIVIHNIVNIALVVISKIASYSIKAEQMLYESNTAFVGAGYTNVNIWRIYYRVIPFVLIVAAVLTILLLMKRKRKLAVISALIYPVCYLAFLGVSFSIQTFVVKPSEVTMESPYIESSINFTREAYDLNKIETDVFPIAYDLTKEDLINEHSTIANTRIIDYPSTLKAINQVQSIRNYYKFNDIDIVKYDINGEPTAVAVAPREFNSENIADTTKSFINEKLRFTHGYGITAVQVNKVTGEGQPEFIVKDIPPVSGEEEITVTEPRIYFGELTNDYVIANSKYKELDYSSGDSDVEYSYQGQAGISMNPVNKLLYSLYLGDFQLLISNYVDSDSKLLINRNVIARVSKVAPFLKVDSDPYILVDKDGRIKWIVNCYTTSEYYPYSQSVNVFGESINYIRESVKAVVDAYDGTVKFYITDDTDPIAQTYNKIYPKFFEKEDMPDDLKEHMQYPETMFNIQTSIFKRYHTVNPEIFYNKTDLWDYAKEKYQGEEQYVKPYYSIMTIFEDEGSLVLMIPYTMANKQNLVGWMAVNCDGENYGEMALYTFPKGENIYGTMQIENKIDNDPEISREMTLWGQGGSSVIRGNMLTVPVKNSLLYIEPVYISSGTQSSLPELKRIIIAYNDKIVMEESVEKALYKLFDYESAPTGPQVESKPEISEDNLQPETVPDGNSEIVRLYDNVKDAMAQGDWNAFGEAFSQLEKEIDKLR